MATSDAAHIEDVLELADTEGGLAHKAESLVGKWLRRYFEGDGWYFGDPRRSLPAGYSRARLRSKSYVSEASRGKGI